MKKQLLTLALLYTLPLCAQQADYPVRGVDFTAVKLTDSFWLPRIRVNHAVTIPASFARCESTGRVKNFDMAAAREGKFCTKFPFDDTDIYKTIEGAAYSMAVTPDKKMDAYVDSLVTIVGKAQEPDGYLYTARTIDPAHPHEWSGAERWVREHELSHELYNSGHMFEAASAHFLATGKRNFLDIALKNADLLVKTFGPGKRGVAPGHEVVEMGLVRLYRITGKKEYLQLARFFIDERGKRQYNPKSRNQWENGKYWQDQAPVVQQSEAVGHAVRAMYLYAAMADVAALEGDTAYLHAIDRIWDNMATKKIYVQGGIGAIPEGERFGENYELPNATAYNETCAAIGNAFWNERMFQLHGDARYIDMLEKVLYNGLISGVGLDGKTFFYTNAMQIRNGVHHHSQEPTRSGWFECSCCPTNMARFLPSLPGYIYAQKAREVYVNLFVSSTANLQVEKQKVKIVQTNNYPWAGDLRFSIEPSSATEFTLKLRVPGWAREEAIPGGLYQFADKDQQQVIIKVNGQPVNYQLEQGYAVIKRKWSKKDNVEMQLPMETKQVVADNKVKDDIGKVAIQRGPLIYCAEWKDNDGRTSNLLLPAVLQPELRKDLFNGVVVLKGQGKSINVDQQQQQVSTTSKQVTLIPYYAWANRGEGEMNVWFPAKLKDVELLSN
ncbi:glycoside hydrolase family 127 protein [Chitinophaga rhizophila]|uniref:Glycoside hydrolase family 127 protein n=1 Tax=Chitinophaga rhizophila TaxID=2866212 RepID=A0ABS7GL74_9BACT|nr:glycoside hydrolase family 127 protein [Chitinophaga rhizophila]MBW8688066.1 glycoside hydrolase family 127 protein [Chitinophaga rhizophila]